MSAPKKVATEHACDGLVVPNGVKNAGLKTQTTRCGRAAPNEREGRWYCHSCLRRLEGIPVRQRTRRVPDGQTTLSFEVPERPYADRIQVRVGKIIRDAVEVWWPHTPHGAKYTREWIERYYPNLLGLVNEAEKTSGWVIDTEGDDRVGRM